jgi:hypothetical protein
MVSLLTLLSAPLALRAQTDARPQILILGTYHMANPGQDLHNMQADDVLAPKRQAEIAQLLEVLKRFNPTKISIESDVTGSRAEKQYSDYLAGKYTLTTNEIDQIGYRLAKELGHKKIYPVDVDGDFPFLRVQNWAKANGRAAAFDSMQAAVGRRVEAQGEYLRSHSVLEMYEHMNSDSSAAHDVGEYFSFVRYGQPWDYAGSDLLAAWYQRNIRIYSNIVALIDSPDERILVLYGAGHLGWLRQNVASDPAVRLRKLGEFTQ